MTNPRFRPRDWCVPRAGFGRSAKVAWASASTEAAKDRLGVAELQHRIAFDVRTQLEVQEVSIRRYALDNEMDYTRLRRLLDGEIIMRFEDVVRFGRTLAVGVDMGIGQ